MNIKDIHLTRRERETLVMILLGLSTKEMCARLLLSHRTIEGFRGQLLTKFDVSTSAQLVNKVWALA
jgi:DNA-binding CsgD family transcriptional regulator